jgi:hypothetical protein
MVAGATDDGGFGVHQHCCSGACGEAKLAPRIGEGLTEDGTGGIVTGETGLAHSRTEVSWSASESSRAHDSHDAVPCPMPLPARAV